MAKASGLGQRFFIGGYDISGDVGSVDNASSPRGVVDGTGINSSANERILTQGSGMLGFNSFFNDATGQAHAALSTLPTGNTHAIWAQSGSRGAVAWSLQGKQIGYDGNRSADGAFLLSTQVEGSGAPLEETVMLTAGAENFGAAGSKSSVDENGAAGTTTAGAICYFQIFTIGGGTVSTLVVEDSANDSTWATLASATITTARTSERVRVTGSVDRYLRVTTTGSMTNTIIAVSFRRGLTEDDDDKS